MSDAIRQSDLEGYLDESLPPEQMAQIELALRADPGLLREMTAIHNRRNSGIHSLGEIWRGGRLSCPSRDQLGSYLLEALSDEAADYIRFHTEQIGCRLCQANLTDLRTRQSEHAEATQTRRRKYYQSSAGHLRPRDKA